MTDRPAAAELLALALEIAAEAAALVAARRLDVGPVETKSTLTDMVTAVDRASESLIVGRILQARPGDGILGEEGSDRRGESGLRWVIDPLDGTTNYLYGIPAYAVSIAVEDESGAVAGVVHDAAHGEVFAAARGGGATLGGEPLAVSLLDDPAAALVGTGFGYSAPRRAFQAALLANLLPGIRDIRRGGSAALDLCAVACGRLDGYYEQGLQHWDHAAGALIVREAGGRIAWLEALGDGRPLEPPLLVAAGPGLFGRLAATIAAAAAGIAGPPART